MRQVNRSQVCSRRQFLSGCAACVGCAAGTLCLTPRAARCEGTATAKPKVRLVFCETTNDKPIWPNVGYDFDARREQVLRLLREGCPEVEFLTARVMDQPKDADQVLQNNNEADGYLICVQGLGWQNDIVKLCSTGKPTLLVDNLFGGSGLFLTKLPQIMASKNPVDWVSSANDQDIVASAKKFELVKAGKSPAEIATAFRSTRHERTPACSDWQCQEDRIAQPDFERALQELQRTKLLVVGGGWGGDEFRKAAKEVTGVEIVPLSFEEFAKACDQADAKLAEKLAEQWIAEAQEVVEPSREDIRKSGGVYAAMRQLMDQYGAKGVSVNCLGGFYGGHLTAYPCLGFTQLNNEGFVGGCEADQMSALTMAIMGVLVGRPGYISDPVIDTSKNAIVYAHCVAMTKPFGVDGRANPYRIRNHSEDRKGAAVQSLLPENCMTTTLEINPQTKQVLIHQAKTIGNNSSDLACRTKLEAVVKGDLEKLIENWRMGWHRVTFYGDLRDTVAELCDRLKLQLIQEA